MKGYWINHVIDIEDPERFGVDSISKAMEIYYSPEYGAALAAGAWREMRPTSFSVPYVQLRCHSREDSIDPTTPEHSDCCRLLLPRLHAVEFC